MLEDRLTDTAADRTDATRRGERVAVLGGAGFIGVALCRDLVAQGHRVRVFGRSDDCARSHLTRLGVDLIAGDVADGDAVIAAIRDVDVVVHLAHSTLPASSMVDPVHDVESNVGGAVAWLARLSETSVRRILYMSSGGTVYGVPHALPVDETHPTDPICSYGITKLAIEKYVAMYATRAGIDHCIVRPSNVYGPGQRVDTGQGIVAALGDCALRREPIEIWGSGEQVRDFVFIDDVVAALVALLAYPGERTVFNVSSGEGRSILDVVACIEEAAGVRVGRRFVEWRSIDVPVSILDSSLLREETGWAPRVSLDTGIGRTLGWLKAAAPSNRSCPS